MTVDSFQLPAQLQGFKCKSAAACAVGVLCASLQPHRAFSALACPALICLYRSAWRTEMAADSLQLHGNAMFRQQRFHFPARAAIGNERLRAVQHNAIGHIPHAASSPVFHHSMGGIPCQRRQGWEVFLLEGMRGRLPPSLVQRHDISAIIGRRGGRKPTRPRVLHTPVEDIPMPSMRKPSRTVQRFAGP